MFASMSAKAAHDLDTSSVLRVSYILSLRERDPPAPVG